MTIALSLSVCFYCQSDNWFEFKSFSLSSYCIKKPVTKSSSQQTEIKIPSSITQIVIQWVGNSPRVADW